MLSVGVDDATGKLQHLRFCESESAFSVLQRQTFSL